MRCAEAHLQSWIRPKNFLRGGGDDRTVDPGVSKHSQSWIRPKSLFCVGGDRTVDPGVSKHIQSWIRPKSLICGGVIEL